MYLYILEHRGLRVQGGTQRGPASRRYQIDLTRPSLNDEYWCSMTITSHLDHISDYKISSGKNRSNRWTYRVFIMNARPD